jgi:hypothetical protein
VAARKVFGFMKDEVTGNVCYKNRELCNDLYRSFSAVMVKYDGLGNACNIDEENS